MLNTSHGMVPWDDHHHIALSETNGEHDGRWVFANGKKVSNGWMFFSCYNSEQANTLLEVNASAKDKDFIMAVNWKKAEEYVKAGKGKQEAVKYAHNVYDENKHQATSTIETAVTVLD